MPRPTLFLKIGQEVVKGRHAFDLDGRNLGNLLGRTVGKRIGSAKGLIAASTGNVTP